MVEDLLRHVISQMKFAEGGGWIGLVKAGRIGPSEKLPPALPIVLYNGSRRWRGPQRFEHLIDEYPKELKPFQPRFSYLLINELKVPVDLESEERNAVGTLFAAQQVKTRDQFLAVVGALERWLDPEEYAELRRDVDTFLSYTVPEKLMNQARSYPEELKVSPKQVFEREIDGMVDRGRKEGRKEGLSEGLSEGRAQGQRSILAKLLRLKFGSLPASVQERLAAADAPQLEAWAERVLTAATLAEVWEDS